jgi:hypothetical protein
MGRKKMGILKKTINLEHPDNVANGIKSDTRSILYSLVALKEAIILEKNYQAPRNIMTGIQFDFASYPDTGIFDPDKKEYRFKDRLIVQFEYTKENKVTGNKYEIFYIDTVPGFDRRPNPFAKAFNTGDKGQLCPPNCPPPPDDEQPFIGKR